MSAPVENEAFATPREVSIATGMDYDHVLAQIKAGTIPSEKYGRIYKVPRRWLRERAGDLQVPPPAVHQLPAPVADYAPLAAVLEILGTAMVQAADALRRSP